MFNDPIAEARFAELQKKYGFQTVVETGTHLGMGAAMASMLSDVVTIELCDQFRRKSVENWIFEYRGIAMHARHPGIGCDMILARVENSAGPIMSLLGSSPKVMAGVISFHKSCGRMCFYLDAHWDPDYWPLLDELKVIAAANVPDSVIIIHDCYNPNMPQLGFDSYQIGDKVQRLDYEYVKDGLAAINPNYRIEYNTAACEGQRGRGILYALP